jgi:hypothetical protein
MTEIVRKKVKATDPKRGKGEFDFQGCHMI